MAHKHAKTPGAKPYRATPGHKPKGAKAGQLVRPPRRSSRRGY